MLERFGERLSRGYRANVRRPASSVAVIAATAIAVGPLYALGSIGYSLLRSPIGAPDGHRLVAVHAISEAAPQRQPLSGLELLRLREQPALFSAAAGWRMTTQRIGIAGSQEIAPVAEVTDDLLELVLPRLTLGQFFDRGDADQPRPPVVISWARWQRDFGGREDLGEAQIHLDGHSRAVRGVLPAGFVLGDTAPDVIVPVSAAPVFRNEIVAGHTRPVVVVHNFEVVASMTPGVSTERVQAAVRHIAADSPRRELRAMPFRERLTQRDRHLAAIVTTALMLFALLVLASAFHLYTATLMAARPHHAVALTIGATWKDLYWEIAVEAAMLGTVGGIVALWLAHATLRIGGALLTSSPVLTLPTSVGVGGVLVMLLSIVIVMAPALVLAVIDGKPLRRGDATPLHLWRAVPGASTRRLSLCSQSAIAAALLTVFVVVLNGSQRVLRQDFGFDPSRVIVVDLPLTSTASEAAPMERFFRPVLERIAALPGVRSAAITDAVPVIDPTRSVDVRVTGRNEPGRLPAIVRVVSAHYPEALGLAGLGARDLSTAASRTVWVNEAFVRRYLNGGSWRETSLDFYLQEWTIAGVLPDVPATAVGAPASPEIYCQVDDIARLHRPVSTAWATRTRLIILSDSISPSLRAAVRDQIRLVDASAAGGAADTMAERLSIPFASLKRLAWLFAALALTGFLLALTTQASMTATLVASRQYEVGVRLALGSTPAQAAALLMREALLTTFIGGLLALVIALAVLGSVRRFDALTPPFEISAWLTAVTLVFLATVVASGTPSWRAANRSPALALRRT